MSWVYTNIWANGSCSRFCLFLFYNVISSTSMPQKQCRPAAQAASMESGETTVWTLKSDRLSVLSIPDRPTTQTDSTRGSTQPGQRTFLPFCRRADTLAELLNVINFNRATTTTVLRPPGLCRDYPGEPVSKRTNQEGKTDLDC